jgi:hypothetical protein
MHIYLLTKCAFSDAFFSGPEPTGLFIGMLVMNYALCIPVLLTVTFFTIYHLWLLCNNTTTIESSEKDRVATLRQRGRIREVKYPYNLGVLRNIQSVLGDNPLFWCWPANGKGDGLYYPTSTNAGKWYDEPEGEERAGDGSEPDLV